MNKVQIVPDELGNVVRQSKNNSEYGYVRLQQDRVTYSNGGWLKRSNVSTLLHGKVEDFDAIGIKDNHTLAGANIKIWEDREIKKKDLALYTFPSDKEIKKWGGRSIFMGYFFMKYVFIKK